MVVFFIFVRVCLPRLWENKMLDHLGQKVKCGIATEWTLPAKLNHD